MKFGFKGAKFFLAIISTLVIIIPIAVIGIDWYSQNHQPALPPIKHHLDLPYRSMLTYEKSLAVSAPADLSKFPKSQCPTLPKNWVAVENAKPGMDLSMNSWSRIDISNPFGSVLWLDKTSVTCTDTINVHASLYDTHSVYYEKGLRTIAAIRIGWYGGAGGREVWKSAPLNLTAQKIPFAKGSVRMIETSWPTTLSVAVGKDWTPGFYLIATISPTGKIEGAAPLIVRNTLGSSSLVLVHSTLTWAAYNIFGGRSLYFGPGATQTQKHAERSRVVSMDRPIVGSGAIHIQRDAISLVQFLELEGISVDQVADTDVDQWPSLLSSYNGAVFSGHAEYFTRREFQAVLGARNKGVNLAFLGGNTAYWQTRIAASPSGAYRHVIVYRDATADPETNPYQATVQFSDKRVNTPGSLITGGTTEGVHVYGNLDSFEIPKWLHIPISTKLSGWASDSEIEGQAHAPAAAPNIHVLFQGVMKLKNPASGSAVKGRDLIAQSIWYTAPSGAAVFNAGITLWPCDLLPSCSITRMNPTSRDSLQVVTKQILTLWGEKEIGKKIA